MVAISTNNMASTFLSHNHIFHQDYLKYSQLLPLWHPYSLRSWALILPLNIKPTFTSSHPILSPFFTEEINFSKELSVFVVSISSPLTHSWHYTNQYRFRSPFSLTVAIVKVTIEHHIIKSNEHVSVLILLFRNIWSSAHSLILIC